MAVTIYNRGLDQLNDFTSGTYKWLLLKSTGYTVDRDHDFVSDLTPASNEISASGYARVTASTKTRTIDDTNDRISYDCDDPAFGSIAAGQTYGAAVLFKFVTNDSDSILIAYFTLTATATDGSPVTPVIPAGGFIYADQGA